ncbi:MAG: pentapeptide repeat-containing protein, partial [Psychromonas sp.]
DDSWKQPDRAMLDLVNFESTDLSFSSFTCVFMRQANLNGAKLYGVRFTGADLRDTHFLGSDFGGLINDIHRKPFTDFSFSDLRKADLSDPIPTDNISVDPYGQYLNETSKVGAWFIGADLRGAKLGRKVLGIQDSNDIHAFEFALENLKLYAQWDENTVFPPEIATALHQWKSTLRSDAEQLQRWQYLYTIYLDTFGEERSARLQSYLTLLNNTDNVSNNGQTSSISDQVCRKSLSI